MLIRLLGSTVGILIVGAFFFFLLGNDDLKKHSKKGYQEINKIVSTIVQESLVTEGNPSLGTQEGGEVVPDTKDKQGNSKEIDIDLEVTLPGPSKAVGVSMDELNTAVEIAEKQQVELFWKPFQSQVSAKGFAEHVRRETGIDTVMIPEETGKFTVGFVYVDEEERIFNLTIIEKKIGVSLK